MWRVCTCHYDEPQQARCEGDDRNGAMNGPDAGEVREGGLNSRTEASVCTNAGADEPADTEREMRLEKAQALLGNYGGGTFHTSRVVVLVIWDTQAENEKRVTTWGHAAGAAICGHVTDRREEANAPTTHRRSYMR